METRTKTLEDRPDRIVLRESFMPWRWGGPQWPTVLFIPLLWPVLRLAFDKKVVFDRANQSMVVEKRVLFVSRRTEIRFADVASVCLSPRGITEIPQGQQFVGPITIRVEDLSLLLHDGTQVKIATAHRGSPEIEALWGRLGELTGRPFVRDEEETGT
jgi:hypothetical protein